MKQSFIRDPEQRGFVPVITITLMILPTIIAVGLPSLSTKKPNSCASIP